MLMMHTTHALIWSACIYVVRPFFTDSIYDVNNVTIESVLSDAEVSDDIYIYLPNDTIPVGEFMMVHCPKSWKVPQWC